MLEESYSVHSMGVDQSLWGLRKLIVARHRQVEDLMSVAFTFEGMRVRGEVIPGNRLVSIWNTLTTKPFPKVAAFQLEERDFEHILKSRRCREDEIREVQEWGRTVVGQGY